MDIGDIKYLKAPAETITKLSDAIRIGSKLRPQGTGGFFRDGKSCALGAAMEAVGIKYRDHLFHIPQSFINAFPFVARNDAEFTKIGYEIVSMNDTAKRTREEIADWLEAKGY